MAERDRMFAKHPKTTFIAAHMALSRQRPRAAGRAARPPAERLPGGGGDARRARPPAARRARRSSSSTRTASCSARTASSPTSIPYYWRTFETGGRVLRLLPRLPRVLEAVRPGPARRGAEEAVLQERAAARARAAGVPAADRPGTGWPGRSMAASISSPAAPASSARTSPKSCSRRGDRVRVVDNLITGKRANLDATCGGGGRPTGRPSSSRATWRISAVAQPRRRGRRLRAAPGGDSVRAALRRGSAHLEQRELDGTLKILVAARDAGVKRLVFAARRRSTATRRRCRSTRT